MPKVSDLRPDRTLVSTNFDGYKLSLDSIPVIRQELPVAPHKTKPSDDQYTLLHAELFSMQNLLVADPWSRTNSYFINKEHKVVRTGYSERTGRPERLVTVFSISKWDAVEHKTGDYNYSMRFVSEKFCVICDGINKLYLFDTGNRTKAVQWKITARAQIIIEADSQSDEVIARDFHIYDARLDIFQEKKQISLALGRVQRKQCPRSKTNQHYMQLHWLRWKLLDNWTLEVCETLEGKGSLYYCAFEPRSDSLVICSNREYLMRAQRAAAAAAKEQEDDDEDDDEEDEEEEEKGNLMSGQQTPQLHDGNATNIKKVYEWTQTDEDVELKFTLKDNNERNNYNIKSTKTSLCVKYLDEVLIENELFDKIDQDLTTWTIEKNCLQITLVKQTPGLCWTSLLVGGTDLAKSFNGDDNKADVLTEDQKPVVNLEAPIEDCDIPMVTDEDDLKIERFNLSVKNVTHTVIVGMAPPLFTTHLRPGYPAAIVTRQDIDASVWLQHYNPMRANEWSLRHEGNLHAFGYVQASKQQRKFMDCSPDLNYAIICESYRHVFLYKSKHDTASGLRNRNGPQVSIGKQHLITLTEEDDEILGMTTAPTVVSLLTEKNVIFLQIY